MTVEKSVSSENQPIQTHYLMEGIIKQVARPNAGFFLQYLLKSSLMDQLFPMESGPLSQHSQATFQDILDAQECKGINLLPSNQLSSSNETTTLIHYVPKSAIDPLTKINSMQNDAPKTAIDYFIQWIWPAAERAASSAGLDPRILIAQAALETGWGQFIAKGADGLSSNNLFNIKSGKQNEFEAVTIKTTEFIDNIPTPGHASFRKYPSVESSFNDFIALLQGNERYQSALSHANNPELFINELHKAGYATDPHYADKILAIYNGRELQHALKRCGFLII